MNSETVFKTIESIPVGVIIAWTVAVVSIIAAMYAMVSKLYNIFEKTHTIKDENMKYKELIAEHTKQLKTFETALQSIQNALDIQKDVNLKQLRHELVTSCESVLSRKSISTSSLCSLEEMYDEYKAIFHGNGYVKTLIEKVRKVPINNDFD